MGHNILMFITSSLTEHRMALPSAAPNHLPGDEKGKSAVHVEISWGKGTLD